MKVSWVTTRILHTNYLISTRLNPNLYNIKRNGVLTNALMNVVIRPTVRLELMVHLNHRVSVER